MSPKSFINPIRLACVAFLISACAGTPTQPITDAAPVNLPTHSEPTPLPIGQPAPFPTSLSLCPKMTVSNAPAISSDRAVVNYQPVVSVSGSELAIAPVAHACLSSGFGLRGGKLHNGIDLYNRNAVDVYAAANGRVKEKHYRDDYGNMLVIEHGEGVFARYAHLESFANGVNIGDQVKSGQTIGIMGNTASYKIPRHLHYEVMTGEWGALSGAFGLTSVDIIAHLPQN